ncbi:MAG: TIGR01212 family radical SAM protein [Syntrophales bacterium]|nr:TIGR01212 family radical SAM protein [Syntrophales bacterium]
MDKKPDFWRNSKRYYDLKSYWRNLFGCNVFKLPIDAGFTCPNRDGKVGWGGCIYCDGRGSKLRQSGTLPSVREQIRRGKAYYKEARQAKKFIAYFQTFTNTYAALDRLKALYDEAFAEDDIIGISVGTRPDCLSDEVISLFTEYAERYHVWIELGLQSIHDRTLSLINRGHDAQCFIDAVERLAGRGINICVHIIVGLPGETRGDVIETAKELSHLPIQGIKIHSLLVLEGTTLGNMFKEGKITLFTKEEYILTVCDILEVLPPQIVIQRLTADGYKDIFLAPAWAINKLDVINNIDQELKRRNSWQGKRYCPA